VLGKFGAEIREAFFSLSRRGEGAERAQRLRRNVDRRKNDHDPSCLRPKGGKLHFIKIFISVEKLANTTLAWSPHLSMVVQMASLMPRLESGETFKKVRQNKIERFAKFVLLKPPLVEESRPSPEKAQKQEPSEVRF
jgi:hypothetical protein